MRATLLTTGMFLALSPQALALDDCTKLQPESQQIACLQSQVGELSKMVEELRRKQPVYYGDNIQIQSHNKPDFCLVASAAAGTAHLWTCSPDNASYQLWMIRRP